MRADPHARKRALLVTPVLRMSQALTKVISFVFNPQAPRDNDCAQTCAEAAHNKCSSKLCCCFPADHNTNVIGKMCLHRKYTASSLWTRSPVRSVGCNSPEVEPWLPRDWPWIELWLISSICVQSQFNPCSILDWTWIEQWLNYSWSVQYVFNHNSIHVQSWIEHGLNRDWTGSEHFNMR